jgi:hypothetical protein
MITRSLLTAAIGSTLVGASQLAAQTIDSIPTPHRAARWELLVPTGTVLPTGAQRDAIKRGSMTAAQLSYVARPMLAVTATLGWARTRDIATVDEPKVNVFTYDVGAELRAPRAATPRAETFMPFAGVGAGARSYDYRRLDVDATHHVAAYAGGGAELGVRRIRLRLEARDYVSRFTPLGAGAADTRGASTRNDVVVMAGLRLVRR